LGRHESDHRSQLELKMGWSPQTPHSREVRRARKHAWKEAYGPGHDDEPNRKVMVDLPAVPGYISLDNARDREDKKIPMLKPSCHSSIPVPACQFAAGFAQPQQGGVACYRLAGGALNLHVDHDMDGPPG
jgi:hypothetical protein